MPIKLIATDLDGTLLQRDGRSVAQKDIDALRAASEKGVYVVIATGRTWTVLSHIAGQLFKTDYAIISNGASIYNVSKQEYDVVNEVPFEMWSPIYSDLTKNGAGFEVYNRGRSYIDESRLVDFDSPHIHPKVVASLREHLNPVDNILDFLDGKSIEKIHVLHIPSSNYGAVYGRLSSNPNISLTNSLPKNVEINGAGTGKGAALEKLCTGLGITSDEVMVFGDAENDLDMLRWAGWSFAMDNASDDIKQAARYITLPNTQNGVASAIHKFLL